MWFCNMEKETLSHLFWECRHVQVFWMQLKDFLYENLTEINITFKTTFGIQEKYTNNIKLNSFIILMAEYFIFINKYTKCVPNCPLFKLYIKKRKRIEKEIALMKDKLREFERNFETLQIFFSTLIYDSRQLFLSISLSLCTCTIFFTSHLLFILFFFSF